MCVEDSRQRGFVDRLLLIWPLPPVYIILFYIATREYNINLSRIWTKKPKQTTELYIALVGMICLIARRNSNFQLQNQSKQIELIKHNKISNRIFPFKSIPWAEKLDIRVCLCVSKWKWKRPHENAHNQYNITTDNIFTGIDCKSSGRGALDWPQYMRGFSKKQHCTATNTRTFINR